MQSTLGTAGVSRVPRGVLNGALAEQTPSLDHLGWRGI